MVKLGEVCDRFGEYGMSVSSKPYDGIRYIRITDITDDGSLNDDYVSADINYIDDDYRLQKGDVLFARTGATVGKTLVYKEEFGKCVYAGYLIRYRPNLSLVLPQFLFYCTHYQEYYNWVKNNQKAAAQPNISAKLYNGYEFPLPPLEEQHRIVSILDASFEKIDALKKNAEENLKNAKALFQQVLVQELKPKEGCGMAKLGDVCELKSGNSSANDSNDGHLAYVKVSDLNLEENKNCIVTSTKFVDRQQNLKNIFPVGSVIFPKRGGAILTNKKRLTSIEVCCDLNIMGVIPCTNLDSHYLFYYFQGLNLGKISSGTTIPQINNKDVSPLLIPLPVIDEQHRIVRTLDTLSEKCRRLEEVAQQTIRECDALKQSILRQAFSGEL